MDIEEIIEAFAARKGLPEAAILAAREQREKATPAFVTAIEDFIAGKPSAPHPNSIFVIFHILGEWREKSAYRPLTRLLRLPREAIQDALGSAITESSHRVMAAVFDGDPEPLYDAILDPAADEFVRSRMCEVLAMVAFRGELARDEVARFLRAAFVDIEPRVDCFVWNGWQGAIAMLGFEDLTPLVKEAFERESLIPEWLDYKDFESDLAYTLGNPGGGAPPGADNEYELIDDVIAELSQWHAFSEKQGSGHALAAGDDPEEDEWQPRDPWSLDPPASNPFRYVGRNDPCPCGSGKKFKKCCLSSVE